MKTLLRILHLEENPTDTELAKAVLEEDHIACSLTRVSTQPAFLAALELGTYELILSDYTLPSFDGLSALASAAEKAPGCPFVFFSGTLDEQVLVEALKQGASDFVFKDRTTRLPVAVRRAVREAAEAAERRRGAEAELTSQQCLNHVLAQSPAVIYSLKPAGPAPRLAWVSENIQRLLGCSFTEACHPDWWLEHIHPQDRAPELKALAELAGQDQVAREYRLRHRSGAYRWIRDEQRPLCDAEGAVAEVVGSWIDITERKDLEEQFRQSQKMEVIGQLAGGIAHDFNNLLTVIQGNAGLLAANTAWVSLEGQDLLKQITAASQRAGGLTRQLLAFSRKQVMQTRPLNLNELVRNLTGGFQRVIGENIRVECDCSQPPPLVQADAGMLEQVLMNLLINARDAMPQGGQVRIATRELHVNDPAQHGHAEARPGQYVCFSVTDTGAGIAPKDLPHIFEPFFTTKPAGQGTGLGLAIVYGIVKQHGGWLEVSSQPGTGTTVTALLPALAECSVPADSLAAEPPLSGGTERILLVEDDLAVRMVTRRVLESYGYRVLESATGREALETWAGCGAAVDLLLTDVVLPDALTGYDLAGQLRAQQSGLKVIFMSGYAEKMTGRTEELTRQKGNGFLAKPCSTPELLRLVRRCLDFKA